MLNSLEYPYISQFHILRHFSKIDENYRTILKANTSFTDEDINIQLAIVGSNFHPGFSKNPIQLWKKVQEHEKFLLKIFGWEQTLREKYGIKSKK